VKKLTVTAIEFPLMASDASFERGTQTGRP